MIRFLCVTNQFCLPEVFNVDISRINNPGIINCLTWVLSRLEEHLNKSRKNE